MLGVECSNHSVPTILFNDLAQLSRVGLFHAQGLLRGGHPVFLLKIVNAGPRESVDDALFAASISCPSSAVE